MAGSTIGFTNLNWITPMNFKLQTPTSAHHIPQDEQSLSLARAIAARIEAEPLHQSLQKAKRVLDQWLNHQTSAGLLEWQELLQNDWPTIKKALLSEDGAGQQRRQNSPFCGILSPRERWDILRSLKQPR